MKKRNLRGNFVRIAASSGRRRAVSRKGACVYQDIIRKGDFC